MDSPILLVIIALVCLGIGVFIGRILLQKIYSQEKVKAEEEAKLILNNAEADAESIKKERILQAKERFLQLKSEHEREVSKKEKEISNQENRLKQKETTLNQKFDSLKKKGNELKKERESIETQNDLISRKQLELEGIQKEQVAILERVSNMSAEEATESLMKTLKDEAQTKASSYVKDVLEEAKSTATREGKKIVIQTIQRTAAEHAIENCVSIFNIDSDDVKGKIIGREGRNIRALEASTGVEIIVDDTPEAIIISGFDPVRREVARLSLHRLVSDGRIHPARIEEVVAKTRKNIEEEIMEIGERTVIELGIHGLHRELVRYVGRMRYRSSYGQNLLQHSKEVARLCATMAAELGLNAKIAKRAGLLHDIGKVSTEEPEKPHAIVGMELAERYKESKKVCNAIGAHHDEIEMTSLISPIVQACDAISGSRPGARREIIDSYIKRLKNLEGVALSFDGVRKCYAIQAGRELRVIVDADKVSDQTAGQLAFDISQKIETEMQYPGQIKVTVIREMRSVSFAK